MAAFVVATLATGAVAYCVQGIVLLTLYTFSHLILTYLLSIVIVFILKYRQGRPMHRGAVILIRGV